MKALGTIEVVGLCAGIEAADVACKAANVELIGYELAKGGGYVTIKVTGDVGAVKAAVDAAAQAASQINRVVSKLVIPRPNEQLATLVRNKQTVGYTPEPAPEPAPALTETTAAAPAPAKAITATTRRKQK